MNKVPSITCPRYGKPSASGLRRVANCPGSHKREMLEPDKGSKDGDHGDRIHAALARTFPVGMLTAQEAQTVDMCDNQRAQLLDNWKTPDTAAVYREVRLGLTTYGTVIEVTPECKASLVFTGQFDALFTQDTSGLLLDYKSLYGDVPDAVDNEQIMGLAVLTSVHYGLTRLRSAIVQPRVGPPTVADFDEEALMRASSWLTGVLEKERAATVDDVTAGDWCKYCKAKASCPAFIAARDAELEVFTPGNIAHMKSANIYGAMMEVAGRLSDAELIGRFKGLAIASIYPNVIKDEMRRRAAEVPDFPYEERATREQGNREITDAQKAFERLQAAGLKVNEADMIAASTVNVTKLQEAVRVRSGQKSVSASGAVRYNLTDKQAKEALAAALGDVLTHKEPPLEIVPVTKSIE